MAVQQFVDTVSRATPEVANHSLDTLQATRHAEPLAARDVGLLPGYPRQCNQRWRRGHSVQARSKSTQPSRQTFLGLGMSHYAFLLNRTLSARNTFQILQPPLELLVGLNIH